MGKKKKRKKKKIKSQILANLGKIETKLDEIQKKETIKKTVTENNKTEFDEKLTPNKTEIKYFQYDLKRLAVAVGITIVLFGTVILLNHQTNVITNFTNKLVQLTHINH